MGDTWQCGECETVNARGVKTCRACSSPAPLPAAGTGESRAVPAAPPADGRAGSKAPWICSGCETVNEAASMACVACRQPRPISKAGEPSPKAKRTRKPAASPGSALPGTPGSPTPLRPPPRAGSPTRTPPLPDLGLTGFGDPSRFFTPGTETPPREPPKPRTTRRPPPPPPPAPPTEESAAPGSAGDSSWGSPPPPVTAPGPTRREPWTSPPPYRPARRRPRKLIGFLLLLAVAAGAFLARGDWLPVVHHITASGTPTASPPAGPPCPADIAATINGGENSTLIAAYNSAKFKIRVCETSSGKIYYHGSDRNNPSLHITLPARRSRHGFKAQNNGYVYYVSKHTIVITKNGVKVLDERLSPVS